MHASDGNLYLPGAHNAKFLLFVSSLILLSVLFATYKPLFFASSEQASMPNSNSSTRCLSSFNALTISLLSVFKLTSLLN